MSKYYEHPHSDYGCHHVLKVIKIGDEQTRLTYVGFCPHCNDVVWWKIRGEEELRTLPRGEGYIRALTDQELEELK